MKRAVIAVIRTSTDRQDSEKQVRAIDAAARTHELTIIRTLPLDGVSGTTMLTNVEVQKVLRDLSRPDVAGIVAEAVDRIIRPANFSDLQLLDFFQKSGKLVFTPSQCLDLRNNADFLSGGVMAIVAGFERRLLLARTAGGKESARLKGRNPGGPMCLPRGLAFSKESGWRYVSPDSDRVRKAYSLLSERLGWQQIAKRIGGGFTYNGVASSLKNPCWMGVRRYSEGRDTPLEVPMWGLEAPLISAEEWAAAQRLIAEKRDGWKARKKSASFLLSGLITCSCGKPFYPRSSGCGSYYCSSNFPGRGPSCGQRSVQKPAAEQTVADIIASQLVSVSFLRGVFERLQSAQPASALVNPDKVAGLREKLEGERRRLLQLVVRGLASEQDLQRESKRIDGELRDLDKLMPAPAPPAFDAAKLAVQISRTFAGFHRLGFEARRELLRDVCGRIVVLDQAITLITLSGSFLHRANESQPSRRP
jgi:DNA invertase Pin-like site-specific DNA recombinase